MTPSDRRLRIEALLDGLGLATEPLPYPIDAVMSALAVDKKHAGGGLRWVLPTADGYEVRSDVPVALVEKAASAMLVGGGVAMGRPGMTRVLVLQGPNLNLLGTREPEIYGHDTLDDVHARDRRAGRGAAGSTSPSSSRTTRARSSTGSTSATSTPSIVNPGGLTHTSVALRDALLGVQRPFWEVHLSDPTTREPFRQVNFFTDVAAGLRDGPGQARLSRSRWRRSPRGSGGRRWLSGAADETPELRRLRRRIDALDRRIVALLNERAELGREVGRAKVGGRAPGDPGRRAGARGAAPGDDGEHRADAPGRPARDLPPAHGGDARRSRRGIGRGRRRGATAARATRPDARPRGPARRSDRLGLRADSAGGVAGGFDLGRSVLGAAAAVGIGRGRARRRLPRCFVGSSGRGERRCRGRPVARRHAGRRRRRSVTGGGGGGGPDCCRCQ